MFPVAKSKLVPQISFCLITISPFAIYCWKNLIIVIGFVNHKTKLIHTIRTFTTRLDTIRIRNATYLHSVAPRGIPAREGRR
jgi:hypothetical protein